MIDHGQAKPLHASCVALDGRAVLILGPSGSGKSSLALQLIAYGCRLVSDDQTLVLARNGALWVEPPAALRGLIEARGVGLLPVAHLQAARLVLVVDLAQTETARLPDDHAISILGQRVPCLHRVESAHFPAAVLLRLAAGSVG